MVFLDVIIAYLRHKGAPNIDKMNEEDIEEHFMFYYMNDYTEFTEFMSWFFTGLDVGVNSITDKIYMGFANDTGKISESGQKIKEFLVKKKLALKKEAS